MFSRHEEVEISHIRSRWFREPLGDTCAHMRSTVNHMYVFFFIFFFKSHSGTFRKFHCRNIFFYIRSGAMMNRRFVIVVAERFGQVAGPAVFLLAVLTEIRETFNPNYSTRPPFFIAA